MWQKIISAVLQSFNFLFFLHVFMSLHHNLLICNVLTLVFVLEFFVYLFITVFISVNPCLIFGCGHWPRRVNLWLIY